MTDFNPDGKSNPWVNSKKYLGITFDSTVANIYKDLVRTHSKFRALASNFANNNITYKIQKFKVEGQ